MGKNSMRVPTDRLVEFQPTALGSLHAAYRGVLGRIAGQNAGAIREILRSDIVRAEKERPRTTEQAAFALTLRVLEDYLESGYLPLVKGERCLLVPLIEAEGIDAAQRRELLRRQFETTKVRGTIERGLTESVRIAAKDLRNLQYDPESVLRALANGPVSLELREAGTASETARVLYRAVRFTWSMPPDVSAPGREVSFVATSPTAPIVPLGIMQYRNVVPEIAARDVWLGITCREQGFLSRIEEAGSASAQLERIQATRSRLVALLQHVRWEGLQEAGRSSDRLSAQPHELNKLAQVARAQFDEARRLRDPNAERFLHFTKRAETASDLLRGIVALERLGKLAPDRRRVEVEASKAFRSDIDAGLRKLWHYHMGFVAMDLSICGAAPPFGPVRTGKLMAALAGSTEAIAGWGYMRDLGQIARSVYDLSVRTDVPNPGPVVVFTSGLYPGHSAQYNRVRSGARRWVKIGDTTGFGNSMISVGTSRAARTLNEVHDGYSHIARRFGEGASARFREIGRALARVGLPDMTAHQVRRPLYALPLVEDVPGHILGWQPDPKRAAGEPVQAVADGWWDRWVARRADELIAQAREAPDLLQELDSLVSATR